MIKKNIWYESRQMTSLIADSSLCKRHYEYFNWFSKFKITSHHSFHNHIYSISPLTQNYQKPLVLIKLKFWNRCFLKVNKKYYVTYAVIDFIIFWTQLTDWILIKKVRSPKVHWKWLLMYSKYRGYDRPLSHCNAWDLQLHIICLYITLLGHLWWHLTYWSTCSNCFDLWGQTMSF